MIEPASTSLPKTGSRLTRRAVFLNIVSGVVVLLCLHAPAMSETIVVDTSWTLEEINSIIDGDPGTVGKGGQADASAGDIVHLTAGLYRLPQDGPGQINRIELRIDGVDVEGEGWDRTVLEGFDDLHAAIVTVYSRDNEIRDLEIRKAKVGLTVNGDTYDNIRCTRIMSTDMREFHYAYDDNQAGPAATPSIQLTNCYLKEASPQSGVTGIHYSKMEGATENTKYAGISNCTFNGLAMGAEAPIYLDSQGRIVVKGNDDFHDNLMINMTSSFTPVLYMGFQTPDGHVESNISEGSLEARGIQPAEGTPNREYLLEELRLDSSGRPLKGSPVIGSQFSKGYCGGVPPAYLGDFDHDLDVDADDLALFEDCASGPSVLYAFGCEIADFDFDTDVDQADFAQIQRCYSGSSKLPESYCAK